MSTEKMDRLEATHRGYARIAGVSYVFIIVAGLFAEFFVRSRLFIDGDAAATAANITAAESLYRLGFVADLVMILCDVVVAWALFGLFARVNSSLAGLAAVFRLVHAAVLAGNLLGHFAALLVLVSPTGAEVAAPARDPSLALLAIEAHGYGYLVAQTFFGVHCLLVGYLLVRTKPAPRAIGVLMGLAGAGYLVESGIVFLVPEWEAVTAPGLVIAGIAEIGFATWLCYLGARRSLPGSNEEAVR